MRIPVNDDVYIAVDTEDKLFQIVDPSGHNLFAAHDIDKLELALQEARDALR